MANDNATLQLPKDLIEGIVLQNVQMAVAQALQNERVFVSAVTKVLTTKVDDNGKPSNYSSNTPFIEWSVANCVRTAVSEVLQEEIVKHKEVIKAQLVREISKKNSPMLKNFVDVMTKGITDAAASRWQLTVKYVDRGD